MTTQILPRSAVVDNPRPISAVLGRLSGVVGRDPRYRAKCPAHASRGATLAVSETSDGTVLLKCHAGCSVAEIIRALGVEMRDLFRPTNLLSERVQARRSYRATPKATAEDVLRRELKRLREAQEAELGYLPPLTSRTLNEARRRASAILGIVLKPVGAFPWEGGPHDNDPNWPALYDRALEEETRRRWHHHNPGAAPGDTDPNGSTVGDRLRAENLAAKWIHA